MKVRYSKNGNILSISFYKIDYVKIFQLMQLLKIDRVSIFVDEGNKYILKDIVPSYNFVKYIREIDRSTVIFDNAVTECRMNKELEVLLNQKILVDFDLGENLTYVLVNLANVDITEENIRNAIKK